MNLLTGKTDATHEMWQSIEECIKLQMIAPVRIVIRNNVRGRIYESKFHEMRFTREFIVNYEFPN